MIHFILLPLTCWPFCLPLFSNQIVWFFRLINLQNLSITVSPSECVSMGIWREKCKEKSMNHLKACECNYSSWSCPEKVGGTASVKPCNTILSKNFSNAVNHTRVPLLWVMPLFLKPWTNDLQNYKTQWVFHFLFFLVVIMDLYWSRANSIKEKKTLAKNTYGEYGMLREDCWSWIVRVVRALFS